MDWLRHLSEIDMEDIRSFMDHYRSYGPLPGILLPFLEAFIPALPLWVFIIANASAYGLLLGFLYSYIGVCAGCFVVFWIFRKFGNRLRGFVTRKMPHTQKFFDWMENKGFTPLFLLCCFPFTPSFFLVIVSGLSTVTFQTFALAILCGKAVMIFIIAFLGHDIPSLLQQPWRLVLVGGAVTALWWGGKKLEARYKLQ
ncbi:hypothetical protein SY83_12690 [Paenibacillus swuensis]|uniref:TVP38/TMEM64 family membrane protein n=2 Tax=Paenibacillus swuensis TaxID=1178515 RepID=A0A172TIX3_9BACL|nr:hypothetical protein SY83_12690 [Paenibacillus swuensis]